MEHALFPGANDIQQILLIIRLLVTDALREATPPAWINTIEPIQKPEWFTTYPLLAQMLDLVDRRRPTTAQAIENPCFNDLRLEMDVRTCVKFTTSLAPVANIQDIQNLLLDEAQKLIANVNIYS